MVNSYTSKPEIYDDKRHHSYRIYQDGSIIESSITIQQPKQIFATFKLQDWNTIK